MGYDWKLLIKEHDKHPNISLVWFSLTVCQSPRRNIVSTLTKGFRWTTGSVSKYHTSFICNDTKYQNYVPCHKLFSWCTGPSKVPQLLLFIYGFFFLITIYFQLGKIFMPRSTTKLHATFFSIQAASMKTIFLKIFISPDRLSSGTTAKTKPNAQWVLIYLDS